MEELNNYHWTFKEGFDKGDISEEIKGTLVDLPYSSSSLNLPFFKVGTFQRLFNFNQLGSLNNHLAILTLSNISTTINLYLNGKQLLKEVYAESPVKLDITDYLKEENILTIEVRSLEDGIYPSINFPVYFELVPLTYIDDIVVSTKNTGEINHYLRNLPDQILKQHIAMAPYRHIELRRIIIYYGHIFRNPGNPEFHMVIILHEIVQCKYSPKHERNYDKHEIQQHIPPSCRRKEIPDFSDFIRL